MKFSFPAMQLANTQSVTVQLLLANDLRVCLGRNWIIDERPCNGLLAFLDVTGSACSLRGIFHQAIINGCGQSTRPGSEAVRDLRCTRLVCQCHLYSLLFVIAFVFVELRLNTYKYAITITQGKAFHLTNW